MAAESSFESASERMFEHHRIEVSPTAVRNITLEAGHRSKKILEEERSLREDQKPRQLVMEMDGVMVPIVKYRDSEDRRKTKELCWMEMKVGAIQDPSRLQALYACSFGKADDLGDKMNIMINEIVGREIPPIHGVGDGALWIVEQGERIGGCQYNHLIDFYHLCDYLFAAFEDFENQDLLVQRCKDEAKMGDMSKVLRRLRREQKKHPNHEGLNNCIRYIKNRSGQFAYPNAIANDLPIGSGLIESTNRSLVQKRLKLPGSWWRQENAEDMAQLRVLRANNRWDELWKRAA